MQAQKIGAASEHVVLKTEFTRTESCGGAYTLDGVWSAIEAVVVRLTGSNLQYINIDGGGAKPIGINMGPVTSSTDACRAIGDCVRPNKSPEPAH